MIALSQSDKKQKNMPIYRRQKVKISMDSTPKHYGFISYTRLDDKELGGEITLFHQRLEGKINQLTGFREVRLFFDREIDTGTEWSQEISSALNECVFFIFFATPTSVTNSPQCEKEVRQFLKRERYLGRKDLFFPVSLIPLRDANRRKRSFAGKILQDRQVADWTVLSDLTGSARKDERERLLTKLADEIATKITPLPKDQIQSISPIKAAVASLLLLLLSGAVFFLMAPFKSHGLAELSVMAGVLSGIVFTPLSRELNSFDTALSWTSLICLVAAASIVGIVGVGVIPAKTTVELMPLLVIADLAAFLGLFATVRIRSDRQATWRWAVSWFASLLIVMILVYMAALFENLGFRGPWVYLAAAFLTAATVCFRNTEVLEPKL